MGRTEDARGAHLSRSENSGFPIQGLGLGNKWPRRSVCYKYTRRLLLCYNNTFRICMGRSRASAPARKLFLSMLRLLRCFRISAGVVPKPIRRHSGVAKVLYVVSACCIVYLYACSCHGSCIIV